MPALSSEFVEESESADGRDFALSTTSTCRHFPGTHFGERSRRCRVVALTFAAADVMVRSSD